MYKRLFCLFGFHKWIITDEKVEEETEENKEYYVFSKTIRCLRCNRFSVQTELSPKD